ncbi:MAG: CRTAC1 family protein, partial [Vicinamibacterales bacterium]
MRVLVPALMAAVALACGTSNRDSGREAASVDTASFSFTEHAAEWGLDFVHVNGMSGRFYDAEIFGPGVAVFDYDNDGDLDVYLVQGQPLPGAPASAGLKDRLFRNDLQITADGHRTPRFTDVTDESRINVRSYGMGVAAGDFDNDGWTDLYLTRLGPNVLLRNNGNGTFADVTRASGTADPMSWSVSASFVDIDRDGWLDLYVANYLSYRLESDINCTSRAGEPDYCDPAAYLPGRDRLFRNRRDGTFVDVTERALVGGPTGPALGIATADFDGDGWVDLYVANDSKENDLWMNQRDGTFRNTALRAGVAVNGDGRTEASMGVDAGDYDNDGDEDLFIANLTGEGGTLYMNRGGAVFDDVSVPSGVRPASLAYTGFGAAWADFDDDGWLDLLTVNGAVRTIEALALARDPFPLHQRKQVFRNGGNGRFEDVTARAGSVFQLSEVGRGAAFGDIDNDGDTDVVIGNNNGPVRLLASESRGSRHWIGIRLVGSSPRRPSTRSGSPELVAGRDMVGARVAVMRDGSPTIWRRARADGSYASANDPRVLVGLGDSPTPPKVTVTWPDGRTESWTGVEIDRYLTLVQG